MPAAVQQLDGWLGAILAIIAALGAFLVPFTGFMKEWWGYAKEVRAAEALKPAVAQQVAATPGGGVFDSIAMADLTASIKELTAAIRADTASDEAQHTNELTSVMRRLTEKLDGMDEERRKSSGGWLGHR